MNSCNMLPKPKSHSLGQSQQGNLFTVPIRIYSCLLKNAKLIHKYVLQVELCRVEVDKAGFLVLEGQEEASSQPPSPPHKLLRLLQQPEATSGKQLICMLHLHRQKFGPALHGKAQHSTVF